MERYSLKWLARGEFRGSFSHLQLRVVEYRTPTSREVSACINYVVACPVIMNACRRHGKAEENMYGLEVGDAL
ncbi:hypothetical protein Y032_0614g685 [Ancylostoma ceylanicum]|nr:hypothetical protein Y032_0614g685 [Ancylostoma ceylanicum]